MENAIKKSSAKRPIFDLYSAIDKAGDLTNTITIKHDGMFELYITCNSVSSYSLTLNGVSQAVTSCVQIKPYDRYLIEWTLLVRKGDVITWSFIGSVLNTGIAFGVSTGLQKYYGTANTGTSCSVSYSASNRYLLGYASAYSGSQKCSTNGGSPTVISSSTYSNITLLDCTNTSGTLTATATASGSSSVWVSSAVFYF